jgi:lipopolysaccharide heptosyltransferase II
MRLKQSGIRSCRLGRSLDKNGIHSILIRAVNWLGDAVMTTPAIRAVRESFPDARIAILANPLVAELFTRHDSVDEVIVYDRRGRHAGLSGRLTLAAELRRRKFDLAVLLQNAFDAALIARLAGIPRRMGYRTDGRGFLLSHGVAMCPDKKRLHHVDYYLAMLAEWGIAPSGKGLQLTVTPDEQSAMAATLAENGIGTGDFLLGINPGATYGSAKRWYPERFAQVADELARLWGARVVITGGRGESGIAGEIASVMTGSCLNLAGRTSVRELTALIRRCNFFITNDSGPMHLAAAFNVPLVAIFGPTDNTTTSPYSSNSVVVRSEIECAPCLKRECPTDHRCMTEVTAENVMDAARRLKEKLEYPG